MALLKRDTSLNDDELALFDSALVPNLDNELIFGLGDDTYVNSLDWDGSSIALNTENEDPDHEELQNLLLDLGQDLPTTALSNSIEANPRRNAPQNDTARKPRPPMQTSSHESFSRETKNPNFHKNVAPTPVKPEASTRSQPSLESNNTALCTCEPQQSMVCPEHAREARRNRMEVILRRRGLLGKTSNMRRQMQNNIAAEQAIQAVYSSNMSVALEDVKKIASQMLQEAPQLKNSCPVSTHPPSLSFPDESSSVIRPPSPILSSSLAHSSTKSRANSSRSRALPDSTSSYTPRSSSVPPRKKNQSSIASSSSRSRKKPTTSESTIDPALLPEGDDPESRRQRRLIRNRMSAQLHRERKREAMDTLQRMIQERDLQIKGLEGQLLESQKKTSSLEAALSIIYKHYGRTVIESLLSGNVTVSPPASPPHLVNSDVSSCTSDEDDNSGRSIPSSPSPDGAFSSNQINYAPTHDFSRKRTQVRPVIPPAAQSKPKKQRKALSVAMMAPLSVCALIACFSITPFQRNVVLEYPQDPYLKVVKPKLSLSADEISMRRRLLLSSNDFQASSNYQDWVISPLENYPSSWKLNQDLFYPTPWGFEDSELLFDFRQHSMAKQFNSYDLLFDQMKETDENNENVIADMKTERESILPGKLAENSSSLEDLLERELESKSLEESAMNMTNESTSLVTLSKAISLSYIAGHLSSNANRRMNHEPVPSSGSNYLFCPSAHAKFTPEFLKLSKFGKSIREQEHPTPESASDTVPIEREREANVQNDAPVILEETSKIATTKEVDSTSKALVPANSFSAVLNDNRAIYKAALEGEDPYMSILLPASAVAGGIGNPSNRRDEPWIEIGCQVLSAKIVHGVNFYQGENAAPLNDTTEEVH